MNKTDTKTKMLYNEKMSATKKRDLFIGFGLLALMFVVLVILEQVMPRTSMLFTVLKKGAIYALSAVAMNLLN